MSGKIRQPLVSKPVINKKFGDFPLKLGDHVYLISAKRAGVVAFVGRTHFASGTWVGVVLPDGTGKNDGSVLGQKYFSCKPMHGLFVRPTSCVPVVDNTSASDDGSVTSTDSRDSIKRKNYSPSNPTRSPSPIPIRTILRKDSGDTPNTERRRKSLTWKDDYPDSTDKLVDTSLPNASSPASISNNLASWSSPLSSNTENLLGRIESALTKSSSHCSSPSTPPDSESAITGEGESNSSSATSVVRNLFTGPSITEKPRAADSPKLSVATPVTVRQKPGLQRTDSSTKGTGSFQPAIASTRRPKTFPATNGYRASDADGDSDTDLPDMAPSIHHRYSMKDILSDKAFLKSLAQVVASEMRDTENSDSSEAVQGLRSDLEEATKSIGAAFSRLESVEEILSTISQRIETLVINLDSFVGKNDASYLLGPPRSLSATNKELDSQMTYVKQVMAAVAQLTRQAMDATSKERWDHAQYAAKLEVRLKRLEHGRGSGGPEEAEKDDSGGVFR